MKFLFVALLCCLSLAPMRAANGKITRIQLQHTECYGACPVDELTLDADGVAAYAGHKNALRQGLYRGQIAPEKFAELARFLESQNFFELRPEIGDGNIDASDTIVSVTRDKLTTGIVLRAGTPAQLRNSWEKAFAKASDQIGWKRNESASKSGVRGWLMRDLTLAETQTYADQPNTQQLPARFIIVNLTSLSDAKIVDSTRTDANGQFQFFAPPGRYSVNANDFNLARPRELGAPIWRCESLTVEVKIGRFADADLKMRAVSPPKKRAKP